MEMKGKFVLRIIFTAVVFLLSMPAHSQVTLANGGGMIDLCACNLKVSKIVEVRELPSPGGSIRPSAGSKKLLKVQLTGTTPREGSFIIKPFTFTAMYSYRRLTYLVQSAAVGVVRTDKATGTLVEMWHTDPDNIFNMGFGANSEITFDIAFEVPKEVKQIEIQAPMIVKTEN
jgi:hypothetical protein